MKPNGKISHILQNIQVCESKDMDKNDYVIVIGGTNDVDKYSNPKEIINNVELTLKNTDLSRTNVILSALPYRYDTPRLNKKINSINLSLQKMSEKLCNVHFTYLHNIHQYDYTRHGLHYNKYGKQKLANIFKNMIDKVCNLNEGTMNIPTIVNYKAYSFLGKTTLTTTNT
jgi:lysophospholipase L1-like esterase